MSLRVLAAAIVLSLLALPALAAEPCKAPPEGRGPAVTLPTPLSETDRLGLSAGVLMALGDPTGKAAWPDDVIETAPPCPLGQFQAQDAAWSVSGGEGRVPPRVVQSATSEEYLFLALGPSLDQAHEWFKAGAAGELHVRRPTYYLTAVTGGMRLVFRLYDGMPSEAALIADARRILEGQLEPLAIFDLAGEAVTVTTSTRSGVRAQLFAPPDHQASIFGPDGDAFEFGTGEAARMKASGFVCPAAVGPLQRARLIVLNRLPEKLDLGCSFTGDESWISLFVTQTPADAPLEAAFRKELAVAEKEGVRSRLAMPVPGMLHGEAWLDTRNAGQGIWMTRRGPYVIEMRATFAPQDQALMQRAVAALARQAAEIPDR